jgi:hypothetical protein
MRRTTPFLLALGSLFLGVCLPYCQLPKGLRLLNLFWSSIDGLGLWAIDQTVGLSIQSRLLPIGVFAWPIFVSILMFIVGRKLLRTSPGRMRLFVISALVSTAFFTTDVNRAARPPLSHLPTFYWLIFVVW